MKKIPKRNQGGQPWAGGQYVPRERWPEDGWYYDKKGKKFKKKIYEKPRLCKRVFSYGRDTGTCFITYKTHPNMTSFVIWGQQEYYHLDKSPFARCVEQFHNRSLINRRHKLLNLHTNSLI